MAYEAMLCLNHAHELRVGHRLGIGQGIYRRQDRTRFKAPAVAKGPTGLADMGGEPTENPEWGAVDAGGKRDQMELM